MRVLKLLQSLYFHKYITFPMAISNILMVLNINRYYFTLYTLPSLTITACFFDSQNMSSVKFSFFFFFKIIFSHILVLLSTSSLHKLRLLLLLNFLIVFVFEEELHNTKLQDPWCWLHLEHPEQLKLRQQLSFRAFKQSSSLCFHQTALSHPSISEIIVVYFYFEKVKWQIYSTI